jgi:hypothetical protein
VSSEWKAFAGGLAEELPTLPAGGLLVISEPDAPGRSHYTQFAQGADELVAYVVVNSFLDEQARASAAGERVIAGTGWRPPQPSAGHENWWTTLPWPSSSKQYLALAQMVVSALRDGYGIADPGDFCYQAWNEQTGEHLKLPRLGLPCSQ